MGGERETVASQKVATETGSEIIGSVRYHVSKSEVHFHDDTNKLKVAVPVATWYKMWANLMSGLPNEGHYADAENGTVLHVALTLKKANTKKERPLPKLDVLMQIEKIEFSEDFTKLNNFSVK